jgi:chromosome segregation ATPase
MSTYLTNLSEKQSALAEENRRLRNQVDTLNARLDELDDSHKKLAATLKKERRRASMAETSAAASTRIEELHARFDDIQADWNTRLDNATSEAARLHMEMMNQAQQNGQRFYTVNGTITSLRSQINHLMANSRGSGGNAGGTASSSGMTGSGANAGGGVSLDTARREPPKL